MKHFLTLSVLVFLSLLALPATALASGTAMSSGPYYHELGDLTLIFIFLGIDLLSTILIIFSRDKVWWVITPICIVNISLCWFIALMLLVLVAISFKLGYILTAIALLWQIINIILCLKIIFFSKKKTTPPAKEPQH